MTAKSAIALTGAIIESVDGGSFRYYQRCDNCMAVSNGTFRTQLPPKNSFMYSSFVCPKCRQSNKIKIQGA